MKLLLRILFLSMLLIAQPVQAQDNGLIQATISQILNSPDRLSLPIEKIRPALKAHYVGARGAIYWVGTGQNTRVNLPQLIPVHVIYATAFSSENGIEFRTDVYGRDKLLYDALFGKTQS